MTPPGWGSPIVPDPSRALKPIRSKGCAVRVAGPRANAPIAHRFPNPTPTVHARYRRTTERDTVAVTGPWPRLRYARRDARGSPAAPAQRLNREIPASVSAPPFHTTPDELAPGGFHALDWTILGLYFAGLAFTGYLFSRKGAKDTDDYFLGGRKMPTWAVAISILATSLSAATFVGGPQQAFAGDLTYLSSNIGMMLAAIIVATLFIPAFYRERVSTIYGLLETRFGPNAKRAASLAFMVGRVFASGARVFIVALPAALIIFGERIGTDGAVLPTPPSQLVLAIIALTVVGIVYTLVGGISSVIWTDVIQTGVFLLAVGAAIALLLMRIPASPATIAETLANANEGATGAAGKLTLIRLDTDPAVPYTLWSALIAFTLMGVASYGADQDLAQRMLTCKSAKRGSWSVISAILLSIPVVMLFMLCGLLLFLFYRRPEIMGDAAPLYDIDDSRTVFLNFILREMPAGMSGLMMAGLFAAGLSSLNSALNAMGSTFINDFYKELRPNRSAKHYVLAGRLAVAGWGVVLGGFACFCVYWQRAEGSTLIDFALGVMTFAYAGLLGVFFTALFTKRGRTWSVIAALLVGFLAILALQPNVWVWLHGLVGVARENVIDIAWPWRLTIGAVLATAVCLIPSGRRS